MRKIQPPLLGSSTSGLLYIDKVSLYIPNLLVPKVMPITSIKIDWLHPLTRGLLYYYFPYQKRVIDLVNNKVQTLSGTTWSWKIDGLQQTATSPSAWIETEYLIRTRGTYVAGFRPESIYNYVTLFDSPDGNENTHEGWIYSDGRLAARYGNVNTVISGTGDIVADTEYVMGFDWLSGGSHNLYINGALSDTDNASTSAEVGNPMAIYGGNTGNDSGNITLHYFGIWDKQLNAEDHAELYRDPYQILMPA